MAYVYFFLVLLDELGPLLAVLLQDVALLLRVGVLQRGHLAFPHALFLGQPALQLRPVLLPQVEQLVAVLFLQVLQVQLALLHRPLQLLLQPLQLLLQRLHLPLEGHLLLEDLALPRGQLLPQLVALLLQVIHRFLQLLDVRGSHEELPGLFGELLIDRHELPLHKGLEFLSDLVYPLLMPALLKFLADEGLDDLEDEAFHISYLL